VARILLVTQPTDGGVFRHVSDLAGGLDEYGHDVLVAAPLSTAPSDLRAEIVTVPMRRSVAPGPDARGLAALAAALRRLRPDIVHAHSSKAGALARLGRVAARRVPVIYTPHLYAFASTFGATERFVYRGFERVLAPSAARVLCVCEAERRLAASIGPADRTRVVHNGIQLPDPSVRSVPAPSRYEPGTPLIVSMAFFSVRKGLSTLIDAMPSILTAHPKARLLILGRGPQGPSLSARADELGLSGVVELRAPPEDRLNAMRSAAVFVHPSWADSFPYSILEAMSLGLPIVASDVGGIGEAIEHGSSGVLARPRDAAGLGLAVSSLLADPDRAAALGTAARARVETCFTVDRMVEGILAVYRELLD
jgi:glycosyltransferase involved in cell wall biosynthesis